MSRGGDPEFLDEKGEGEIVDDEPERADRQHIQPVGLGLTLQHTEQEVVDSTTREGIANTNVDEVRHQEGDAIEDRMEHVEQRGHEEEHVFDGFGDSGQEGREGDGGEQSGVLGATPLGNAAPHRQTGPRQSKHHGGEATGKVLGGMGEQSDMVGISQLGEENLLCAYNRFAGDCLGTAEGCVPEHRIDHVVKADGAG